MTTSQVRVLTALGFGALFTIFLAADWVVTRWRKRKPA